ncbi:MAG TPA: cytochrome c [Rhodopila sp.]|nr:cytochrome c [Rhodopila sp.]
MCRLILLAALLAWLSPAFAAEPVLTLHFGDETRRLTAAELLARPDAQSITMADQDAYKRPMTYRAVPLLALLPSDGRFDALEVRATDGFAAQLPIVLLRSATRGGAVPWLAIEPPDHPWPILPGKNMTAGPFYIVWQEPERSGVVPEQWPYAIAELEGVESPAHRWPQLRLSAAVPADAPARRGQEVFVTFCLACHRLDGGGAATMGPDLGRPMSPTQYFTGPGLRALIRDPKSVRTWPEQRMPGFDAATLPDADLEAVVAYLTAKATE